MRAFALFATRDAAYCCRYHTATPLCYAIDAARRHDTDAATMRHVIRSALRAALFRYAVRVRRRAFAIAADFDAAIARYATCCRYFSLPPRFHADILFYVCLFFLSAAMMI